jgi:hypothetical protein
VIQFAAQGSEASLNVSQALAVGGLRESHRQIMIPAREIPVMTVSGITGNALLELVMGGGRRSVKTARPAFIYCSAAAGPSFSSRLGRFPSEYFSAEGRLTY